MTARLLVAPTDRKRLPLWPNFCSIRIGDGYIFGRTDRGLAGSAIGADIDGTTVGQWLGRKAVRGRPAIDQLGGGRKEDWVTRDTNQAGTPVPATVATGASATPWKVPY